MTDDEAMADEFDTMAAWTADAVAELGPEHAVPAGCRGSGSPAALRWLAGRLGLGPGTRLLDCGAGVGGPAELAAREFGMRPVLAEPMLSACRASARLFGRPVVAAAGERLPFADGMFDAVWSLGVLCTAPDQAGLLAELRRVVRPGGRIGLVAYLRTVRRLPEQPEGNSFRTDAELAGLLSAARLGVLEQAELADFAAPGPDWQAAADRVDELIERRHGSDPRWQTARHQEQIIGRLISDGRVAGRVLVLSPA
ncbi:class I SAM-dependent methyltransferase [Jatrophihabitans sp.]|uniref:class I SAM-dependent methyltransferase n=1 Tax=Jatrophihabitans sp. TaxID=1932789 RepID=UPI002C4680F6|nr:class I SAM-dependent methyltransferase [Jatrophihabitans sp.]